MSYLTAAQTLYRWIVEAVYTPTVNVTGQATALGQAAMAASMPVTLASDQTDVKVTLDSEAVVLGASAGTDIGDVGVKSYTTVACGELQGSATALQMPSVACKMVKFKARNDNAGNVYIGGSGVTKPDGTTDTTTGIELDAGEETGWLTVSNLNVFYRICDNAGDDLTYLALS